jgi:hypothetical protein
MCRRCGEPDRRGNTRNRRARKQWLLAKFGNGIECPCTWCGTTLTFATLQQDRIVPGGPYRRDNLVPACGKCNIARNLFNIPDGCEYGPVGSLNAAELGVPSIPRASTATTRAATRRAS